jgi:hypothetical protein
MKEKRHTVDFIRTIYGIIIIDIEHESEGEFPYWEDSKVGCRLRSHFVAAYVVCFVRSLTREICLWHREIASSAVPARFLLIYSHSLATKQKTIKASSETKKWTSLKGNIKKGTKNASSVFAALKQHPPP